MADSGSLIDFPAYGLTESEVRSAAAMNAAWVKALKEALYNSELADEAELIEVLYELPKGIGQLDWQRRWIRIWDRLTDTGITVGTLFQLVFNAAQGCESELYADPQKLRPMHLQLGMLFRKVLIAACCGAVESKELIKSSRSGIPGEVTALHTLQTWSGHLHRAAVLSLSLVNEDTRGYLTASDLQQLPDQIYHRLRKLLRPQDMIFSGRENEWLLLLADVDSKVQPSLAGAHIERAFVEPMLMGSGRPVSMSVAIGAALMPEHGRTPTAVIQSARLARWGMKPHDKGLAWFRPEQAVNADDYSILLMELRKAIEFDQLSLYLQPQIDLESGLCIGAELLLRWQREKGDIISPPEIVDMVQQNGWQELFTDWLIRCAMRIAADLQRAGIRITLSVNLTADNLTDPDLPDVLAQRLEAWDLPGHRFILELTESAIMGDKSVGLANMERLRALGFQMSLDDFGTGYSSLSYLVALPIHELKVDRSFVIGMFDSDQGMQIVKTIIGLATSLGMVPLAEGIDDERQAKVLKQLGCKIGQGYLYAKPMPLKEFVAWYKARR